MSSCGKASLNTPKDRPTSFTGPNVRSVFYQCANIQSVDFDIQIFTRAPQKGGLVRTPRQGARARLLLAVPRLAQE